MIVVPIFIKFTIVAKWGLEARLGGLNLASIGADQLVGFEMGHMARSH